MVVFLNKTTGIVEWFFKVKSANFRRLYLNKYILFFNTDSNKMYIYNFKGELIEKCSFNGKPKSFFSVKNELFSHDRKKINIF